LAAIGVEVEAWNARGQLLALSELNLQFRAPLRSRDTFRVTAAFSRVSGARIVLSQKVLRTIGAGVEQVSSVNCGVSLLTPYQQHFLDNSSLYSLHGEK
jgi:acyl-CoA thioesterase FadM